ncbi:MAG: Asp-tRNA(Asn)/Glu-tRNA(Gln) amidotransferase subunit GatA [Patescibacteria group bacterium]|nr:Asp-tRNA(Asn)/Glu-tRNA(Gln) amidotransferase subunit GatA [Patescibacteria group bacterium]
MDLKNLTIKKLYDGLKNKTFSALEIINYYLKQIEVKDKEIGAYLFIQNKEELLNQAKLIDEKIKNNTLEILNGLPLAVKDNILIENWPTTAASKILENYIASYDATVIQKLKQKNVIFLGKTNLDEFAMGSSTENSAFKITKNPYDLERVPGGSSGGSAAAVAADLALAALGSDTGGSIRQPASLCGIVGLKPTYGAISRFGLIAMASSLDQIGPLTKTVEDAAIIFSEIYGQDKFDSTSYPLNEKFKFEILNPNFEEIKKLKIGLPKEYFVSGLDSKTEKEISQAIENFKKLGFEFKEISLPHTKYALSCYYIIMPAEVSSNLARFDGIRYSRHFNEKNILDLYLQNKSLFGQETKRRIILGTFVLSSGYYDAYYNKAQKIRNIIKQELEEVFQKVDLILSPTSPTVAFKIGEKSNDPLQMYLSDIFTIPANLAGIPAISIPTRKYQKTSKDLPVGFQLMTNHFNEKNILGAGLLYEQEYLN